MPSRHELDHLNGVLMFDRMTPDQRREALAEYRRITEQQDQPASGLGGAQDSGLGGAQESRSDGQRRRLRLR